MHEALTMSGQCQQGPVPRTKRAGTGGQRQPERLRQAAILEMDAVGPFSDRFAPYEVAVAFLDDRIDRCTGWRFA